jgi:hypothetical protein
MFVALNESLDERELESLVREFLEISQAADHLFQLLESGESGAVYQALFHAILRQGLDGPFAWIDFVRNVFPEPPGGFEWVGRYGNEARNPPVADSPRIWPVPDPDDEAHD